MNGSSTFLASNADSYEAQMGRWSRLLAPLLVDFAGIHGKVRVLDVGCGTGSLALELARRSNIDFVHGIDLCPAYIQRAREGLDGSRMALEVADACALPFEDASFDHCLSSLVLQFIPDPARALREMLRVTRRGGTVTAATWDNRGGLVVHRMFFDTAAVVDPDAGRRRAQACARPMSQADGLRAAWQAAGLTHIRQQSLTIRMTYVSFEDFWSSIDGQDGPYAQYLQTLGGESRARLRSLVAAAYLDGEPDGLRSYAATAWAISGTKHSEGRTS